jgi:hypothetical protein
MGGLARCDGNVGIKYIDLFTSKLIWFSIMINTD